MPRPFKPLPNVSEAKIVVNQMDPLLARGGIARKLAPDMEFKDLSSKIKATNRYLVLIQNRLERYLRANKPVHFWVYALLLMKRSTALRLVALRKLQPNWHREMKLGLVKGIMTRLNKDINELTTDLFIARDYVPKIKPDGSKSWRPVGVPSYPHRMYTYLLQSFIVMFVKGWLSPSQHGFIPERGVNTATSELTDLLENPKYKYAYEFDLKGAFPSIIIPEVVKVLKKIGFPPALVDLLERISVISIERVDLVSENKKGSLPEPKFDRQVKVLETVPSKFVAGDDLWSVDSVTRTDQLPEKYVSRDRIKLHMKYASESEEMEMLGLLDDDFAFVSRHAGKSSALLKSTTPPDASSFPVGSDLLSNTPLKTEVLMAHNKVLSNAPLEGPKLEIQGFPQGLGISPILFDIAFDYALIRNHFRSIDPEAVVVAYADDFVVFSPNRMDKEDIQSSKAMEDMGLVFNWDKSRMIKSDGLWLVDSIKFLGITFNFTSPESSTILVQGTPKSGVILDYDKGLTVDKFIERDNSLRRYASALNLDESPQELLDQWGMGLYPGASVPLDVIQGKSNISTEQAAALAGNFDPQGQSNREVAHWAKKIIETTKEAKSSIAPTSAPHGARHRLGVSKPLAGLRSRLKGLLINRLHGGSWEAKLEQPVDRSLSPKASVEGTSWIERIQNVCVKTPSLQNISHAAKLRVAARLDALSSRNRSLSIYNSTSYATKDLMGWMKRPSSLKLTRKGIRYD